MSNLITLYAAVSGEEVSSIENRYVGKGYAEFKRNLAELIIDFLQPIQARYTTIAADPADSNTDVEEECLTDCCMCCCCDTEEDCRMEE